MEHKFERKINYYETDKMGVVHHSNYIRFLEEARCQFLVDVGLPYELIEENGIMMPVVGVSCEYKYPVTFGDNIVIKTRITDFTGVRYKIQYQITNKENGNLVVNAETRHCFTDFNLKPVNSKKSFPEMYEKFMEIAN
ncbi:1,4-dihydroxy-2-naphthoyl-CoA hydrolase [compost metagenome]